MSHDIFKLHFQKLTARIFYNVVTLTSPLDPINLKIHKFRQSHIKKYVKYYQFGNNKICAAVDLSFWLMQCLHNYKNATSCLSDSGESLKKSCSNFARNTITKKNEIQRHAHKKEENINDRNRELHRITKMTISWSTSRNPMTVRICSNCFR